LFVWEVLSSKLTGCWKKVFHASRACYVDVKPTTHETSFFLSSS
jgi:hypothetical protein